MPVRLLLSIALILAALVMLFLMLLATDTALSVWQRLGAAPLWAQVAYGAVLLLLTSLATWLLLRWFRPPVAKDSPKSRTVTESTLHDDLVEASGSGIDVNAALAEIREQRERKQAGTVHLALFGEVSSGKSSLIKALVPGAVSETGVLAGTTTDINKYTWKASSADRVVISDLPGFNDASSEPDPAMRDEAMRAHLVIYLCDADIGRIQHRELELLQKIDKPLLIAINKSDRFSAAEQDQLRTRMAATTGVAEEKIINVSTGGTEQIFRTDADGSEQLIERPRAVDVSTLCRTIQKELDQNRELIESLRDSASLFLVTEKLDAAKSAHRNRQAEELVGKYSRRAVIGAMAAIAPGSDLVIQGVLATSLVNELCRLFGVRVRDVEIDKFLRLAGGKMQKLTAITLAISGNVLKAFPGLGTVAGGLVHAVAYGMIFDSLGRAVSATLASRGELRAIPAAATFEDLMSENLESRARRFAGLALAASPASDDND